MDLPSGTLRRASIALLVGLLMTMAGCSALAGTDGGTAGSDATNTDVDDATTAVNETTAADETNASDAANGTDSALGEDANSSHSHDGASSTHSHGDEAEADASNASAEMSGRMAVMIAGERVDLTGLDGEDAVRVDDARGDTWYSNESPTLAAVLSDVGVDATATTLTYDGETYDEGTEGTKLVYRADGEPVVPGEYRLEDGDQVWVVVVTDDMNVSTPGEYIPPERLHVHGNISFTVDGETIDFGRDKYQRASHNHHFHFEGGHADPWHAHSAYVTLAYAMSTLEGINMTDDHVTYNGTAYAYEGGDATVTIRVNGEPVDPTEYYLKDGDSVTIEITSSE
jgi:hypothetical protein